MRSLTCKNCGWVSFGVSRKHAIQQTYEFANYFNSLPKQTQMDNYGGRQVSLLREYARCFRCGASNNLFRASTGDEIQRVDGCTLSAIIFPEEKVV